MVCEGSDNELTDEELREKRLRYEDHAQKYMRGCLPILRSARLRGPLEDRSEWSNPWRYHPPKRQAKRDISHARGVVASRHGSREGGLRADRERPGPSFANSSGINRTNASQRSTGHGDITHGTHRQPASIQSSSRQEISRGKAPAASNSASGIHEQERRTDATRQKQSRESQWLKGSYVSKRARWDDAAVDTPTPNPQVYNQKTHRKIISTGTGWGPTSGHSSSHPLSSFPDIVDQKAPMDSQETSGLNRTIELSRSVFQHVLPSGQSASTPHDQQSDSGYSHYAQQLYSNYSSPNHQSTPAFSQMETLRNRSYLALQADRTPDSVVAYSNVQFPISTIGKLPQLPKPSSSTEQDQQTPRDEVSFITEVAPSSRNLEEFQYKKRRTKGSSSASASGNHKAGGFSPQWKMNARNAPDRDASQPILRYDHVEETNIKHESDDEDDENEDVLASGPYRQWYEASPAKDMLMMGNNPLYNGSGLSQNSCIDAPSINLSSQIASNIVTKANSELASIPHKSPINPSSSQVTGKYHNSSNHIMSSNKIPNHSPTQHKVPTPRQILSRPPGIDGSSTQSYNTTPARSSGVSLLHQSPFERLHLLTESHSERALNTKDTSIENDSTAKSRQSSGILGDENDPLRRSIGVTLSTPVTEKHTSQHQESERKEVPPPSTHGSQISDTFGRPSGSVAIKIVTPKVQSQVIGPTEQSPWTKTDVQPPHKLNSNTNPSVTITSSESWGSSQDTSLNGKEMESNPQSSDHQATPENDGIRLFSDMVTPPPPSRLSSASRQQNTTDTQQIAARAVNNPWNSANTPSIKSNKRVSFGILSDHSEDSGCEHQPKRLGSSPPPPNPVEDLGKDDGLDGDMVAPKFAKHFSVFKQSKGLSQHDLTSVGSPSIGAMAEAFIAADRDTSIEEERRRKDYETARHLKPSSPSMVNAVRRDTVGAATSPVSDVDEDSPSEDIQHETKVSGFDMDDALGGFADFLGDWSVEGELQKARNASQKSVESNGAKRRRLFGIV
jgi:hypothetical protein